MPTLKHIATLLVAISLPGHLAAQAAFYIDSISIDPPLPTTADPITITLHGSLTMTNAVVTATSNSLLGNNVYLIVTTDTSGSGVPAMVPHDQSFAMGTLPGGTYFLGLSGDSVFDSAPGLQHIFAVSGGGGWICDSLNLTAMEYSPVSDASIRVLLENTSMGQLNDQCVYLYDQNGDLLAGQTVFAFPIVPGTTGFYLDVWPGATIPQGVFTGTVEIWSNDCTVQECVLPWNASLCPSEPCTNTTLRIEPNSTAAFPFAVPWELIDGDLSTVASGTLQITGIPGTTTDTFCLSPGPYSFVIDPLTAPDSTFIAWAVMVDGLGGFVSTWNQDDGNPDTLSFTLYEACIDSITAIVEPSRDEVLQAVCTEGVLVVTGPVGTVLGDLWLFTTDGRVVQHVYAPAHTARVPVQDIATGVYLVRSQQTGRGARAFVQ